MHLQRYSRKRKNSQKKSSLPHEMFTERCCAQAVNRYHQTTMNIKKILLLSLFSILFSLNEVLADFTGHPSLIDNVLFMKRGFHELNQQLRHCNRAFLFFEQVHQTISSLFVFFVKNFSFYMENFIICLFYIILGFYFIN